MDTRPGTWSLFDERTPLMTYTYSFGPALSTALAVRGAGGMVVVSPPRGATAQAFDDVTRYGPVCALVASNAFHHLGIPEWSKRFPDATVFAPAQAIPRVTRKSGLPGIRSLADIGAIAGPDLELIDMPHYRTGEVLVRASTGRGRVWYVTDIIFNMRKLPAHLLARILFRVTRSAPGLRMNNLSVAFTVRNRRALRQWLAAELVRDAPQWIVPAHGEIARIDSPADTARDLFG